MLHTMPFIFIFIFFWGKCLFFPNNDLEEADDLLVYCFYKGVPVYSMIKYFYQLHMPWISVMSKSLLLSGVQIHGKMMASCSVRAEVENGWQKSCKSREVGNNEPGIETVTETWKQ